jgi:diadenosine tetraphosphate (Ap4A) HIT family hydrolase
MNDDEASNVEEPGGSSAPERTIAWLGHEGGIEPEWFGWKAANLCRWATVLVRAPQAFVISRTLLSRVATGTATESERAVLHEAWTTLLAAIGDASVIIRSSSFLEHAGINSFAGLFVTVPDVTSFEGLLDAIKQCHTSAHTPNAQRYASLRATPIPDEHMAAIVQRKIQIRYAALVQVTESGYLIEAYDGDLSQRIRGSSLPQDVISFRNGQTTILRASNLLPRTFFHELREICKDLRHALAKTSLITECLLEVGSDGNQLYVLQLSPIRNHGALSIREPSLPLDVRGTALETETQALGIKGAAMKYFRDSGLFELPLWVFAPGTPIEEIRAQLSASAGAHEYTIRYSHTGDLGLPRSFRPDVAAVIQWILETRTKEWATIVHPHVDARHSFEMLLTGDSVLLEHITGLWESENSLDPDVMMIRDESVRVWVAGGTKNARFAYPEGLTEETIPPTSLFQIRRWIEQIGPIAERLRLDLAAAMPLNIHFIEDTERRWFFLNIRRGFGLENVAIAQGEPHVVESVSDLQLWDRHSPILLRFRTQRGNENRVVEIAEKLLHHQDTPILIDFGLLSHPALILRELGFTVVPTYLHAGNRLLSPSYQTYEWPLDRDHEPISRIRHERPAYEDKWVRVVPDRDPIVPGHLLVVAEEDTKSFADSGAMKSIQLLLQGSCQLVATGPWLFVERGRARFCTSGFTAIHAHGHLLPAAQFTDAAADLFAASIGATRYSSIEEAFRAARRVTGEYILAANSTGHAFVCAVPTGATFEKRQIRNFFGGAIR